MKKNKQRCNFDLVANVAKQIKQLRVNSGLSQETFQFDTDIHIARIESGRANITISTLSDICAYFGVSLSDFFSSIES